MQVTFWKFISTHSWCSGNALENVWLKYLWALVMYYRRTCIDALNKCYCCKKLGCPGPDSLCCVRRCYIEVDPNTVIT